MKGIVLAGGLGTRLHPLTKVTNKHLLPVYNQPMIYYPISTLVKAGIKDIMIVTGGERAGDFLRLLGNGSVFGLPHLHYGYQEGAGGIAEALYLARHFAGDDCICVILGDNIFQDDFTQQISDFEKNDGAMVFLKEVENPQEYGVAVLEGDKIVDICEKPKKPPSNYAVVGLYVYEPDVFKVIETLTPSERGELEITDVNRHYLSKGRLRYKILNGYWGDAGESIDKLLMVSNKVRELGLSLNINSNIM
ncbi:MAG: spore coat protein [Candidatus Coatesbacteria bacterium 4484_99]|uniref:glucose-1-phosphate thymidylyltransferase n=1 Tax=Candidatus Coatesbacteria bacterium 4484_99 TaxID=1970774 RepID=A0A1W9S1Z3_9BACT|nr:MAG: spore coat protein [Candidatus Coatesbacteria bacterium 4484_99]RLC41855.1 MAG: spore coat protein [Candidatus Coatesbacteria bacterium]RLC44107.1 MAG: spore coat protein [Candidatus Coatesbacteria bacterium]HEC80292.1 spore coat protein [Bacillota bacterium]